MGVVEREAIRYLGYGNHPVEERTKELVRECILEGERALRPRHLVREFPLIIGKEMTVDCGCFLTESRKLAGNLSGCSQVLLMAATLGLAADRQLHRLQTVSAAKAVVMQAVQAAMLEDYCNKLCRQWKELYEKKGLYLRPRFSPGYGDFPLSVQKQLLSGLEAEKRLGITLTDGYLMVPTKSVTAVIGLGRQPAGCVPEGCEACEKRNCKFRR